MSLEVRETGEGRPGCGLSWGRSEVRSATEVGMDALDGTTLVEQTWPMLSVRGQFPMVRLSIGSIVARKSDSRPSPPNRVYPKPS